jgi:catechol 2,3-dioxygenase-like lactoylglutathione lyase family enzyme
MRPRPRTLLPLALLALGACRSAPEPAEPPPAPLRSIAVRVANVEPMLAFYTQAFGARFREVDAGGVRSHFARMQGFTLKLVPLRDAPDFEGWPTHQLGFEVPDVAAVIALAERYGGRQEGPIAREDGRVHAAVRDPDGNSIELYGPQ